MPGTITALTVQKRNKERVNVYLDGEFAFGLSLMEAARLHKGQVLTDAEIAELQGRDAVARAVDQAVRFLSYRPRSTTEIRRNLAQKKVEAATIDEAVASLERLGYLDDLAFARFWVENRDEFNPRGPLALRNELRKKGVSNRLIEQAMEGLDFAEAAYRAVQGKVRRWQDLDRRDFQQKVYGYLSRRGFTAATIRDVIDRYVDELELPEPEPFDYDQTQE